MKKYLIFLFSISFYGNSQEFRSYVDNANEADKICAAYAGKGFTSEKIANSALEKILSTIGASKRFVLSSCENIPNAMAISLKGIRYIFYNREFMAQINSNTNYWSNMSILAHEVGHHINGHTTDALLIINDVVESESLSESRKMELEADEFAGFVLAKLGATLTQASEAIALLTSDEDDTYSTHPSKSKRLAAIRKGYNNGSAEKEGEITTTYKKTSSSTGEEYFYSAYEKADNGDHYGAIADYTKAIELKPYNVSAYYNRGLSKKQLKNYYDAIADYNKVIEIDSDYVNAYYSRGNAKQLLKNYYDAIADYNKVIEIDSDYTIAYYNRGNAKFSLKDYYGAIADYTKTIELDPNDADSYNNRGLSKSRLKDYYGAIADFTTAIELKPYNTNSYFNRGVSKMLLRDDKAACEDWRIAARYGNTVAQDNVRKYCN